MAGKSKKNTGKIDHELIRELSALLEETGLTEIEIEHEGLRVRVGRQSSIAAAAALPQAGAETKMAAASAEAAAPKADKGEEVRSPMVGTVYLSPEPGAELYVQKGARVEKGQTLLIIEAMKTMNHIPAPRGGVVLEVLVSNEQPVEFNEPLILLE